MAAADTLSYDELVLEIEWVADSGTYSKICGITGVTINRTTNVTSTAVPDCADETLPHSTKNSVNSIAVSVSGTGVWAAAKHHELLDWFYNARKLNARLRNAKVEAGGDSGDIYAEYGPAILSSLTNERPGDKGEISASIELQFDGTPSRSTVV